MKKYTFSGAVLVFGRIATDDWSASTMAPTKRKAISNLKYRFKMQNNYIPETPITFEGEISEE